MEFTGVYHKTSEQMSYALDEDRLVVNLKTGYDVKQVFIIHGDPFDAGILGGSEKWSGTREEIVFKKRLPYQIWWTTTLMPPYKRCKYYFELHTDREVWYYFEDGFLTKEQMDMPGRLLQYFIVPWMNPADVNRTPAWVNDTVWYQIFPDRFCSGDPQREKGDVRPWQTGPVTNQERYGGDLEGIRQKLPYLAELGITGIYLNPIMEAETNHKYDTTDYTKIDPAFGDDAVMERLVAEAHEKGLPGMRTGLWCRTGLTCANMRIPGTEGSIPLRLRTGCQSSIQITKKSSAISVMYARDGSGNTTSTASVLMWEMKCLIGS